MKQTAVEWLIEQLPLIQQEGLRDIWEEAIIQEREQIRSAYIDGQDDILEDYNFKSVRHLNSLHYYQKTFNK